MVDIVVVVFILTTVYRLLLVSMLSHSMAKYHKETHFIEVTCSAKQTQI